MIEYTDQQIQAMLEQAAKDYAAHKGMRARRDVKRRRCEAVWIARRHGWKLKQVAHVIGLSISRTSVL